MSSFKAYGKVNELEQSRLDARRKTRRRVVIISLSSIVLVCVVVAAVVGTTIHNNNSGGKQSSSLSTSVKAVCDVTLYQDSCYSSLGALVNSTHAKPEDLFKLAIQVAINELSKLQIVFRAALENCQELLSLALDHLNDSLSDDKSLFDVFDDLKTWLSSSGTYQQTCIDGFDDAKAELKDKIVKWLHPRDRKLIESSDLRKKADIVVASDGSGKYKTIHAALKDVPDKSKKRTVIYVKKGVYFENVRVEKTKWNVLVVGDGSTATIVSAGLNVIDGTPTFSSATFAVFGKGFIARDIGFRNTAGAAKHQAVALMSTADQSVFYRPWKNYSTTVYMQTFMGSLINPSGWLPWVGNTAPDTIFYSEFQNFGPGSSTGIELNGRD
ncbi:putative pectinesterase/pectinesterase inhibitor 46 [Prunus yedoensis var. nudiflora]|uniref:Putative pectinesterase/pectinesterase inhibitor 46 n=1 Tax=Prunus yedoensis var. nudiflora TaxID=2094558 RepID=A0A314ZL03_PRUYE|nr:putative pectinesterase/pectinesterase inhibitor 46 [Prunus yedoensis var. nudiflora]